MEVWMDGWINGGSGPSNKEFHAGTTMMITPMCYDISDHKFLLVLLSYFLRIDSLRIEDKWSKIVNMGLDLLA
jgi:hypothetical protein